MAKTITRQTLKLFGKDGASSNFGQFGSAAALSPVNTKVISTIQALSAWLNGWQDAVAAGQAPYLQDMNSLIYVLCYEAAYMLQDGIPEWDSGTSYYIGSIVRRANTSEVYASKIDDNLNQALPTAGTSDSNWQFLSGIISSVFRIGGVLAMNSQKITGLASGAASGEAIEFSQYEIPVRNMFYNGNLQFWQRGTSVTIANTASTYLADRFYAKNALGTNGVITYSQVAAITSGSAFGASIKITTAPTVAQTNGCEFYQTLENADSIYFLGKSVSASALIKALGNVNQIGISFMYKTSEAKVDTLLGSESLVTVNSSTFTLASVLNQAVGTTPTASGVIGIRIRITAVSSGNTYDLNNGFIVEQVMGCVSAVALAFSTKTSSVELEFGACQRYYEKSYSPTVAPATNTSTDATYITAVQADSTNPVGTVFLQVRKRTDPTVTLYRADGTSGSWQGISTAGSTANITSSAIYTSMHSFRVNNQSNSSPTLFGQWTADSEI